MLLTIGHSNHAYARFLEMLRGAAADAVIDVRSLPYSRRVPHFNGKTLQAALPQAGIEYHYLGQRLGGRPPEPDDIEMAAPITSAWPNSRIFCSGSKPSRHSAFRTPVLMCAERYLLDCHRCLLVGRALAARGATLAHILADGSTASQQAIEDRLLAVTHVAEADLFATRGERRLTLAYGAGAGRGGVRRNGAMNG